ncbi:MAG: DUF1428 domain-containing protein [Paracoccaceae bacterium]
MSFVDGFVVAVPTESRAAYGEHAAQFAAIFREYGATRVVEAWGADVPEGAVTSFPMAVKCAAGETVVFSWIEWPDRATRDAAMAKMRTDPRFEDAGPMPFDGKRMIMGGFEPILDVGG